MSKRGWGWGKMGKMSAMGRFRQRQETLWHKQITINK